MIISGKAATFETIDGDGVYLLRGCFDEWLQKSSHNVPLFFHHKKHLRCGEVLTFQLKEDGLYHISRIDESLSAGRDMIKLQRKGVVDAFSIGLAWYESKNDAKRTDEVRYLKNAEIDELSMTPLPAAKGAVRNGAKHKAEETATEAERRLRSLFWYDGGRLENQEIYDITFGAWKRAAFQNKL